MKAIRIELTQNQANYRKEETIENKMTYPLPPMSTVIGAIHKACGFKTYRPMDISIQGSYGSMQRETYKDYAFLNSTMNDRGILVKMRNPKSLSTAYDVIAEACAQNADFEKEIKIKVINRSLLDEYKALRRSRNELADLKKNDIDVKLKSYKEKIKLSKDKLKDLSKGTIQYDISMDEIKKLMDEKNHIESEFQQKREAVEKQYGKYATLVKSQKFYEVLYDVHLIIHIVTDDTTMEDIMNNINNITSIGRSEDFVDIKEATIVTLQNEIGKEISKGKIVNRNSGYISKKALEKKTIIPIEKDYGVGEGTQGTKYFLNKDYHLDGSKRIFNKKWVYFMSCYEIDDECELGADTGIYHDGKYIVCLV